jgi:predicted metal-dependent hydrolase
MNTEFKTIKVGSLPVQIHRKSIKNLHLGVYPPNGRVRVSAPVVVSDSAIRLAVINKLGWIKKQQRQFANQPRQSEREMVSGETHYFQGRAYRLKVEEGAGETSVNLRNRTTLVLRLREKAGLEQRERLIQGWYRDRLKECIPSLLAKWQPILGVTVREWGIRKMKTKWGSCNSDAGRIWLNLELAKKPAQCLEYLVVHELVHLIERKHSARFMSLLERAMPKWRHHRQELNAAPLGHEAWKY